MQNLNRNIVVTRPKSRSGDFALALTRGGFTPVVFPLFRLELHPNALHNLRQIQNTHPLIDWLLLTSPSAVHFYYRLSQKNLPEINRVAVIGEKTADACRQYEVKVDFMPSQADFATFIAEFKTLNPENVLFPHSALTAAGQLRQLHTELAVVNDFVLYENKIIRHSQAEWEDVLQQAAAFTFFSPSAVNSFLTQIQSYHLNIPDKLIFFSIGTRTTEALQQLKVQNTIITVPNGKTGEMLRVIQERLA